MKQKLQAIIVLIALALIWRITYLQQNQIETFGKIGDAAIAQKEDETATPLCQYQVVEPRVNYVKNPMGIDHSEFSFSWKLCTSENEIGNNAPEDSQGDIAQYDVTQKDVAKQEAYQIYVWDEHEQLIWDSGVVLSSETTNVPYTGDSLQDLTRYEYQIISYDNKESCGVSSKAYFTTAYLNKSVFEGAKFISMQGEENIYGDGQPVFYHSIELEQKSIKSAYYLGSALGVYDAYINGERIGKDECKPGWTNYYKTLLYNMYDVTAYMKGGEKNYFAAMLGTGWWCGRNGFGTYEYHQPAMVGELVVIYEDGTSQRLVTDENWQYYKDTQIQFADFFNGETVDFNKPSTAQIATAYMEQLQGKQVEISNDFTGSCKSYYGYQYQKREDLIQDVKTAYTYEDIQEDGSSFGLVIRADEYLQKPEEIQLSKGKTLVVDLGQNIAGVPSLRFLSEKENEISITFAEMLNDCGMEEKGNDGPAGSLYRKNYRSAATTVILYPVAGQMQTYASSFFFTGFRYLAITAKEDVKLYDIQGIGLSNVAPELGSFFCDQEQVNQLYQNVLWSQRNNYSLIATDCPQRDERLGWMGDLRAFATTSLYNQDLYAFYEKWLQDIVDSQTDEGAFTDTVPMTIHTGAGNGGWAEAGILVPYEIYKKYGDISILQRVYPAMHKYMDYLATLGNLEQATGQIGPGNIYGDWLSKELTDSNMLCALWYLADAKTMQEIAGLLGEKADVTVYEKLKEQLVKYLQSTYLKSDEDLRQRSQTELCFLIRYQVLSSAQETIAKEALAQSVEANDYLLMTGFAGTPILLDTLCTIGRSDLAYRVLLAEGNPSWLYSINQGATTIWERYDSYTIENGFADFAMNSFDHFNEGSVAQWMYEDMLGVHVDITKENPIVIKPYLPDDAIDIHNCQGSYDSIYGKIEVKWSIDANRNALVEVTIPCNQSALLELPIEGFETMVALEGKYTFGGKVLNYNEH